MLVLLLGSGILSAGYLPLFLNFGIVLQDKSGLGVVSEFGSRFCGFSKHMAIIDMLMLICGSHYGTGCCRPGCIETFAAVAVVSGGWRYAMQSKFRAREFR